ncbi:MAG: site-2 protease family protein [Candidatus Dadabacteria bacterium]|nr:site-2 protease family protein [Candidatus Dadabacteria bacterium]
MDLSNIDWRALLLGYPVLLLALTVHETAHAWTADRLGDPTARLMGRVSLNPIAHIDIVGTVIFPILAFITHIPLIGWAKPVPVNPLHLRHPSRDEMLVSIAGPASNLLLAVLMFVLYAVLKLTGVFTAIPPNFAEPVLRLMVLGVYINVLLCVFNLVPIPPLDGSHILENLLPYSARESYQRLGAFGYLIIMFLFATGILGVIIQPALWVVSLLFHLV